MLSLHQLLYTNDFPAAAKREGNNLKGAFYFHFEIDKAKVKIWCRQSDMLSAAVRHVLSKNFPSRSIACFAILSHPGGNPGTNPKSISHRCYLREVAFEWGLTKETTYLPLGCLLGG